MSITSPITDAIQTQQAIAMWMIDNTSLTFKQIATFCSLHEITIRAIADLEINTTKIDPVVNDLVTQEEITRCQNDPDVMLQPSRVVHLPSKRKHASAKDRHNKPNAIAWIIKQHPHIDDTSIAKLLKTTQVNVHSIRNKTHRNYSEIVPVDPCEIGITTEEDLMKMVHKCGGIFNEG